MASISLVDLATTVYTLIDTTGYPEHGMPLLQGNVAGLAVSQSVAVVAVNGQTSRRSHDRGMTFQPCTC